MTTLPTLTDEQRHRNLELAMEARRARAELKRQLKAGQVTLADALDDERAQRMYVRQLLASLPGIASERRVHGLGKRQRSALIALSESDFKLGSRKSA